MPKANRVKLQAELEELMRDLLGLQNPSEHVSFQPDEQSQLSFPHLVYVRDPAFKRHADNIVYAFREKYTVTYMDRKPDSPVIDHLERRALCSHTTSFVTDGLNHSVFDLYH